MHTYQKKFLYIIGAVFLVVRASATAWYFSLLGCIMEKKGASTAK